MQTVGAGGVLGHHSGQWSGRVGRDGVSDSQQVNRRCVRQLESTQTKGMKVQAVTEAGEREEVKEREGLGEMMAT